MPRSRKSTAIPLLHESSRRPARKVQDIQRIAARIAAGKAIPREFHALGESLRRIPELKTALQGCAGTLLRGLRDRLQPHEDLVTLVGRAVVDDPPGHLRDGGVIREGYSPDLDSLIAESRSAKSWIAGLEKRERERTGIPGLKVGFNKVFGYYIEVSKLHRASVPADYVAQADPGERGTVLHEGSQGEGTARSRERREARSLRTADLQGALRDRGATSCGSLQETAAALARIDAIHSLAASARQYRFRRPVVDDSLVLELAACRHPVLEQVVKEPFVPNDLLLDPESRQFALITGPNMSGKSTFLRQVALTVVLAQMGSFVPAERARIGIVDKVFTRVGATDRLSRGESTFLVEMKETANILERMTDRSLVLLDEVGRGTSTYDGLSIAWAVTEYILAGRERPPQDPFRDSFPRADPAGIGVPASREPQDHDQGMGRRCGVSAQGRARDERSELRDPRGESRGSSGSGLRRAEDILKSLELRRDLLRQGVPSRRDAGGQFSLFRAPHPEPRDRDRRRPDPRSHRRVRCRRLDASRSPPARQEDPGRAPQSIAPGSRRIRPRSSAWDRAP